ncbi:MAG TPA: hypothetical protein VKB77_00815 [Terriglobales bacterium]|nr:hypothetical protein [Terriglobales bacterium]HKE24237.1 hypothetical protein [Bryobacteraceae bacterium]
MLVVLLLCLPALAQQKVTPASSTSRSHPAGTLARPKLTPDEQRGLRQLKNSQAESAGLQPEMRAFVLWQVARGYSKLRPEKGAGVLREAMQVAMSMQEENVPEGCGLEVCHMKPYLELHLLEEMLEEIWRGPEPGSRYKEIEPLLPRLEPEVRKVAFRLLVGGYADKDQFARARALLSRIGDDEEYPYEAVEQLMLRDPSPEDRLAIFTETLARYRGDRSAELRSGDPATLVMRFSHDLPSAAVLDAIDQILARAKEQDEGDKTRAGINSAAGSVYFDSRYQLRLFQLLPVLKDLDPAKAESLLRDNSEVSRAFDRFPRGPQSMDPKSFVDKPLPEGDYALGADVHVIGSKDPAGAAAEQAEDQAWAQIEGKMEKAMMEAEKDPQQAYEDAQELPPTGPAPDSHFYPRADALRAIAQRSIKKDPAVARKAMNDVRRFAADLDPADQGRMLTVVPNFYVETGDLEEARNSIKDLMKLADKLYARDVDPSDPNLLFKGFWPATALWRRCVQYAAKVSPEFAEEILSQISDADIAGFERVIYGATLAGAPRFDAAIMEWRKGGSHRGIMF